MIKNTVELLYLGLMSRWENTAPDDKHQGLLDGTPEINSQVARISFLLKKIAAGAENKTYQKLALHSRRNDGESYISRDSSWMEKPKELFSGWYLEGCMSLEQKRGIISSLSKLGMSSSFVRAAESFVAGESIKPFIPSYEEQDRILAICLAEENRHEAK